MFERLGRRFRQTALGPVVVIWAAGLSRRPETDAARAEQAEAEAARAEAEAARAEATALRLQLNPHFLFNTLNSISSLVTLGRKDEAEAMIQGLGEFRPGTRIGLANIRQRLAIRYHGRASLGTGPIPDGWRAEIRLPR